MVGQIWGPFNSPQKVPHELIWRTFCISKKIERTFLLTVIHSLAEFLTVCSRFCEYISRFCEYNFSTRKMSAKRGAISSSFCAHSWIGFCDDKLIFNNWKIEESNSAQKQLVRNFLGIVKRPSRHLYVQICVGSHFRYFRYFRRCNMELFLIPASQARISRATP